MNISRLLIPVLLIGALVGCQAERTTPTARNGTQREINFGYQPFGNNLPFFVAVDKGYFEHHGLKIKPVKIISANDAGTALLHGQIAANATLPLNVILNIEEQEPGRVKAFMFKTTSTKQWSDFLLVPPNSRIKTLGELAGGKVGGYPGTAQQTILKLILSRFFDPSKATLIELAPNVQLQALKTGQIDALLTYDETALTAIDDGAGRVLVENPIGKYVIDPFYGFAYAVSGKFAKDDPQSARAIIEAMTEASEYIRTNESDARAIMAKWVSARPEVAARVRLWAQIPASSVDKIALQRLADIYFDAGVMKKKIDTSQILLTPADLAK